MTKVKRFEYIIVSRVICRTLFKERCWGKNDLYFNNLAKGLSDRDFDKTKITKDKIKKIIAALVQQEILCKKKKMRGWKYYLNKNRKDKIKEICKEVGKKSIIPILLML